MLAEYFTGSDDGYTDFKDFIGDWLKPELSFTTNQAILDVIDFFFDEAVSNSNFE